MKNGANPITQCSASVSTLISHPSLHTSSRLITRSMPTIYGLSLPSNAGGSQSTSPTYSSQLSSHRQSICRYMSVLSLRPMSTPLADRSSLVFDRMFSLGMRGNGPESQPLGARVAAVAGASSGPRRHFLYCALKNEPVTRAAKKSRDFNNA